MKWARFSALVGTVLFLALLPAVAIRVLPRHHGTNLSLPAVRGTAYADGLGDVFGEKKDESDEGTTEGSSGSNEGEKEDSNSGGLADVFGEKEGEGGSGPYTTEPQTPPTYYYYPYDPYYDQHHYYPGPDYGYPQPYPQPPSGADSFFPNAEPGSLEAALRDITLSWLKSDTAYLQPYLAPDGLVKVYRGTRIIQTLSSERFLQVTREAFQAFKTVSLVFGEPDLAGNGSIAYCPAEHILAGPDGIVRRAHIGYELERMPVGPSETKGTSATAYEWVIKSINQDIGDLLRSRCFIASAAYGTPMAEEVSALREFRDRFLLTNPPGRLFVRLYYELSPPLARKVASSPTLAAQVRFLLKPVVNTCKWALEDM